jgi:hypothetical protein
VVLRNIILPDLDVVIIMTSNRAEAEAAFGEIWQQAGITHDVMRAALCATGAPPRQDRLVVGHRPGVFMPIVFGSADTA